MCRTQLASGDEAPSICPRNLSAHLEEVCDGRHDDDNHEDEGAAEVHRGEEGNGGCDWDRVERQEQDSEGEYGGLEERHRWSLGEARSLVARHTVARLLDNAIGVGGSL